MGNKKLNRDFLQNLYTSANSMNQLDEINYSISSNSFTDNDYSLYIDAETAEKDYGMSVSELEAELDMHHEIDDIYVSGEDSGIQLWTADKELFKNLTRILTSLRALNSVNESVINVEDDDNYEVLKDCWKVLKTSEEEWVENKIRYNTKMSGFNLHLTTQQSYGSDEIKGYKIKADEFSGSAYTYHGWGERHRNPDYKYDLERFNDRCKEGLRNVLEYLKAQPEFNVTSSRISQLYIDFTYIKEKDQLLRDRYNEETAKHEEALNSADTSKYAPTPRDWEKMINYKNKNSNPERVAQSCKDNNKIVARYIIARAMGWGEAVEAFKRRIKEQRILTDIELEAYTRKYATYNAPEEYQELMDDIATNDVKGGLVEIENSEILPAKIKEELHNNPNVISYTVELCDNKIDVLKYSRGNRYNHGYSWTTYKLNVAKLHLNTNKEQDKVIVLGYHKGYNVYIPFDYEAKSVDKDTADMYNPTQAAREISRMLR